MTNDKHIDVIDTPIALTSPSWMSLRQAAVVLEIDRATLAKYIHAGKLQATKQPNGRWRVSQQALERFASWYAGEEKC